MMLIFSAILAILGVVILIAVAWWGLPILVVAALIALAAVLAARRADATGRVAARPASEPSGRARPSRGGAETANERVGQD